MSVTLDTVGPRSLRRRIEPLLTGAADAVQRHMRERMPDTLVRLAGAGDFGPAVVEATGGTPRLWRQLWQGEQMRSTAHIATGMTLPTHDGRVLVLLHTEAMREDDQVMPTLVHEFAHAVQMGRPAVANAALARNRHHLGLGKQSRRWLADHNASVARDEDEAYRIENLLTPTLATA
ncbi:hypothetical protein [Kitasatospora azatica]|uniref:hypothetical protein n=1 Tax=Kitasatospora azatica TaxID=58347 RepID=UPI0005621DC8|nr:hypothetical protein [Kitasatospora azatica]